MDNNGDKMYYSAKITKDKHSGFIVTFPDKENVFTTGETIQLALKNAEEALNVCMETELDLGMSLVEPKTAADADKKLFAVSVRPELEVAYRIFEARRGKTKQFVATSAGITKQAYQRFETPKGNPTVATLGRIAKALGKKLEIRFV